MAGYWPSSFSLLVYGPPLFSIAKHEISSPTTELTAKTTLMQRMGTQRVLYRISVRKLDCKQKSAPILDNSK